MQSASSRTVEPAATRLQDEAGAGPQASALSPMRQRTREAAIATLGNAIEWFDFVIFGFMTVAISRVFFPAQDPAVGFLAALATFGAGFAARPIGAVVFGRLGDRRGRKRVLVLSISIMALASFTIGLAPTYAQAGVLGPVILVIGRLLQGVSAGAEFGNAIAYLIEWAPPNRQALFGSLQQVGAGLGLLLGALATAVVNSMLSSVEMLEWGWRLPFLAGGVLALIALLLRLKLHETPVFEALGAKRSTPIASSGILRGTLQIIGLCALWTVSVFAAVLYVPTYAQEFAGVSAPRAFWATVIGACVMLPCVPLAGWATDRFGVRAVMTVPVVGFLLFALPGFIALSRGGADHTTMLLVVCGFAILAGIVSGVGPVAIGRLFPPQHRSTWTSIGAALAITVFGGFAPLTSTLLIRATGWTPAPGLYISVMALLTGVTLLTLPRAGQGDLSSAGFKRG